MGLLPLAALVVVAAAGCGNGNAGRLGIIFLSSRNGDWALYAMDPSGRNERRVSPAGFVYPFGQTVGYGEPVVSPDGRKVLLARDGLTVTTIATGASKRVARGEESSAAWSPDSERLVFSGRGNGGLYVVDLRSGRRRTLIRKSLTWTPTWSPDGEWIVFSRQIGYGPIEVYAIHPDGSDLKRLSAYAPGGDRGLAWSADGRVAFIGARESEEFQHLVVVDVQTGHVSFLQSRLGGGTVAWSPDGQTIAYASASGVSDISAIYTLRADGSGRHRLTPSPPLSSDASPVWSPDGKSLLFVRTPVGGGAERYVPQVWTMRADGSQRRPLTKAYPDGGENVEPAWIRGTVHAEPAPHTQETRHGQVVVLRVPFAVNGISAEGAHAAIAPVAREEQRGFQPTPPILVWRPGHGEPAHLVASPCGGVQSLVLARNRLAFDCNDTFLDEIAQSVWVVDLRTRLPREVFFGRAGNQGGIYLDHIVGGGGLLAFGSVREDAHFVVRRRTLWRIDDFDSIALRARPGTGDVVAADGSRLALELANGHVAITRADGALVRVLPLPRKPSVLVAPFGVDPKPPFLFAGGDLVLLEHGTLGAYNTATGKLRWQRRVPRGAQLENSDGRLIVYTTGSSIHLLSRGVERVVHTGARQLGRLRDVQRPVHAALTANGLYYCFNIVDRHYPGRVVFVPRSLLRR